MWRDLTLNLVSEAIGIAVTVFLVDRLQSFRERRRWRRVQKMVWQASWQPATSILECWARWLTRVTLRAGRFPLGASDLVGHNLPVPNEELTKSLESKLGSPIGKRMVEFSDEADKVTIEAIRSELTSYLAANPLPSDDVGWQELKAMEKPLTRLTTLAFSSSVEVDPDFALPILRLTYDLDNLQIDDYQLDILVARLAVASMLAESIEHAMLLRSYLRTKGAGHWLTVMPQGMMASSIGSS